VIVMTKLMIMMLLMMMLLLLLLLMMMMMTMPGEKQYKFEEILPIYKAVNSETDVGTFADFMEAFKTFDREGQGYIAAAELRHVLTSLGKQPVSSTPSVSK